MNSHVHPRGSGIADSPIPFVDALLANYRPSMRPLLEHAIESLIAFLDDVDGDADLEPSIGSICCASAIDAEGPDNDLEPSGDECEPSLGWTIHGALGSGWDQEEETYARGPRKSRSRSIPFAGKEQSRRHIFEICAGGRP